MDVYKESKALIVEVYGLINQFPREEQFAMCDQLRRAAVSITSNLAEGSGRKSVKEKIHFLEYSYGSLMEVISQLDVAVELGYLSREMFDNFEKKADKVAGLLSGLKSYFETQLKKKSKTLTERSGSTRPTAA